MTPRGQRRWVWFQQAVDVVAVILGSTIAVVMLIRNSWSAIGVGFSLVLLGKVGSSAFLKSVLDKWAR